MPKSTFGLYPAEHPAAPKVSSDLTDAVVKLGVDPYGHMMVSLQGGQLWQLEDTDPVLARGDSVIIKRGRFGSFLLTTPSGRLHRAHRVY